MNYGAIKEFSIENGPGVRVSLFVSGCRNHCPGCFSQHTWDFGYGEVFDEEAAEHVMSALTPDYIEGLTVLGGEPLEPENQPELLVFLRNVRDRYPKKSIWMYTGFVFEELSGSRADTEALIPLLSMIDVLVDGPFAADQRNLSLAYRGSENQRILNVKMSLEAGSGVWAEI